MEIHHDRENSRFFTEQDGCTAYIEYVESESGLDIVHTIVPKPIGGRGIAAELVRTGYGYARENHLKCLASCSYARAWLERHPEYKE
ncbi:MAG: GNAT family N-acetyltransferase [Prevotella sp.]|nr:N-acetyltransferase [Prevotella sp.]MDY6130839.1 GNAT family N-acetyltransferase [Prevotella sp.]